jgi:hypothetical protein
MPNSKIAILGATSHIAKGIIYNFVQDGRSAELVLFARNVEKVKTFLSQIRCHETIPTFSSDMFGKDSYATIINCVGLGTPEKVRAAGLGIFRLTEYFDNLVLDYLSVHQNVCYINFSSGAVYGTDFSEPALENSCSTIDVNHINSIDYYRIAKTNSEAKHRALSKANIVDLRIFSYFSRFADINARYLITDILRCLKTGSIFKTNEEDIIRDFVHHEDLYRLLGSSLGQSQFNGAVDVYSCEPIRKSQLIAFFKQKYGLQVEIVSTKSETVTGIKSQYYSLNKNAKNSFGYNPRYSSINTIDQEVSSLKY